MAINGGRPVDRRAVPHLFVRDAAEAAEFYQRAFGASELYQTALPGGGGRHVHLQVQDSVVLVTDENPELDAMIKAQAQGENTSSLRAPLSLGATSVLLEMYVDDVDAAFQQAVAAGATVRMPVSDMFFGDRYGQLTDPYGHVWALATATENLNPAEAEARMQAALPPQSGT